MTDFIVKYFGRILAIMGCSTLVTACYGVPYIEYISGRVVDSETDQPIKDIKVRAVSANESLDSVLYDSSSSTDSLGYFNIVTDRDPSGYIIECTDIDGDLNGSYESIIEEIPYDESEEIIIKMTPDRKK